MHKESLDLISCQRCGGNMELLSVNRHKRNEIVEGIVKCSKCAMIFHIREGILDLIPHVGQRLKAEREHWDAAAKPDKRLIYDSEVSRGLRPPIEKVILKAFDRWTRKKRIVVLEICCGNGTGVALLPDIAREVNYIGVDVSMRMLVQARKLRRRGWRIDLIRADANKPLLKSDLADVCFSFAALHHLHPPSAIRTVSLQLARGGYFVLYEPNRYSFLASIGRNLIGGFYTPNEAPLSPFAIRALLCRFGIVPIKEQGLYTLGLPLAFLFGILKQGGIRLAPKLRLLTSYIFYADELLSKFGKLSLVLASSVFQCYLKR